jgi:protein-L-isoaspartate(D-aspartate) O-methyltransferase
MGYQHLRPLNLKPLMRIGMINRGKLVTFAILLLAADLFGACRSQPASDIPTTPDAAPSDTAVMVPASPEATAAPSEIPASPIATLSDSYAAERQAMVENGVIGWGITDQAVIQVMGQVPRHAFVPEDLLHLAYQNHPLPIGYGQTISQPYIVGLMTEALDLEPGGKVLEIGTGSGYQAAILAELVDRVYTIEIIAPLAEQAAEVHRQLGYENISGRTADGYYGWPEEAPFDAIIVTAAPDHIPQPLVQQLKIGGRLVIPVGPIGGVQTLWLITREAEETVRTENLGEVRFVPFVREDESTEDEGS